jgi:hypothetical protein
MEWILQGYYLRQGRRSTLAAILLVVAFIVVR